MYLPLHNVANRKYIIKIPISRLGFLTVLLPLISFILCVLITMYKDFEKANNTHCKVPNVFPSISASIGNYEPQTTIWKVSIFTHAPLRFFIIYLRWRHYRSIIAKDCLIIVKLAICLNVIENLSLLGLTYWNSLDNYPYHEKCFKTFIGTSIFYMLFTCVMMTKCRRRPIALPEELLSLKLKWRTFFTNVVSFALAAYFFLRHNSHCEPYVYSMFGFTEYIVVVSNILFHMTTILDLKQQYIYCTTKGFIIE
ncbi:post-GPI attachment to proteins factor 2 [Leptidea sinapis]|uniref:CWH43-like N-terminal domain-containing protein n=1 Tax=Leptidea sinapis TaxID=189913 RepID=A0A5E4PXV9_9NEOP|nr:post-GPI attachment to proteins factor 2 [Leptidea sinapis]VVC89853.1 unnamed protein product [Leptidea sinapis]